MSVELEVNGKQVSLLVDPSTPLLWVLREELGLTGTKFGCGAAQCGACTVHVDGVAVRSCVIPASSVTGRRITTIEGLASEVSNPLVRAWIEKDVPQCGYCQCGQIMSAAVLLSERTDPSD
ncbi:MAG: (2Fe-2S)-binding protein, partial [Planctomycetota bacterium]